MTLNCAFPFKGTVTKYLKAPVVRASQKTCSWGEKKYTKLFTHIIAESLSARCTRSLRGVTVLSYSCNHFPTEYLLKYKENCFSCRSQIAGSFRSVLCSVIYIIHDHPPPFYPFPLQPPYVSFFVLSSYLFPSSSSSPVPLNHLNCFPHPHLLPCHYVVVTELRRLDAIMLLFKSITRYVRQHRHK